MTFSATNHGVRRSRRRSGRATATPPWRRPELWAEVTTAALVIVAPLLFGGAMGWSVAIIGALAAISAWVAIAVGVPSSRPFVLLLSLALSALVWTGVQRTPLPASITSFLSPTSAHTSEEAARALGESAPTWVPLTLDPGGTTEEIVKAVALLGALMAGAGLARRRGARTVLRWVAVSACVVATIALLHLLGRVEHVYGWYDPVDARPRLISPLLNENHLAGFLALGVAIAIGLGVSSKTIGSRVAWLVASAAMAGTALLTLSRGGTAAVVLGATLLGGLLALARRVDGWAASAKIALTALVAASTGLALGVYAVFDALAAEVQSGDTTKFEVHGRALEALVDAPWVGVGRGAFSAAFARDFGTMLRFDHPENVLLQWGIEWGVPFAIAFTAGLGVAIAQAVRRERAPHRLGALVGVIVLGLQNLVDFSLEMLGIAVVVAATLGALAATARSGGAGASPAIPRRATIATAVPLTVLLLVLAPGLEHARASSLRQRLTRQLEAGNSRAFEQTLADAIDLHPSEPVFPLLASVEATRRGDPAALRWANRAMVLAPGWTAPHVAAAQWLLVHGRRDQALLEFREAAELDATVARIVCRVRGATEDAGIVLRSTPRGSLRHRYLDTVGQCPGLSDEVRARVDTVILAERPMDPLATIRTARRLAREGRIDEAIARIEPVRRGSPRDIAVVTANAAVLQAAGRHREAVEILDAAESLTAEPTELLVLRARSEAEMGDLDAARATIDRLRGRAAGRPERVARASLVLASIEERAGNFARAMRAYEDANRLNAHPGHLANVARLAERLGDRRRAYGAYQTLCAENPGSAWCAQRDRLIRDGAERAALAPQR